MAKTAPKTVAHPRQAGPLATLELPPSWVAANQRRVQLLRKRRTKAGLSPTEAIELRQIQDLTRRYLDAAAPISFEVIEDLKRAVEEVERRAGRPRNKAG